MNGTMVTLVGIVVSDVKYSTTVGGVPVANFRLAATDRRFDRQRQTWVDGDTSMFVVWSWRWLAENVLGSVGRGDPLLITGRMRVREWDNGAEQPKGFLAEIEAASIGHDLCRGTSAFRRAVRARPELVASAARRAGGTGGTVVTDAGGTGTGVQREVAAASPLASSLASSPQVTASQVTVGAAANTMAQPRPEPVAAGGLPSRQEGE